MADGADSSYGAVSGNITTSSKLICGARSRRDYVIVQNTHASNLLYIGPDTNVTAANGIRLNAGESMAVPSRGDVYGIASAAATTVIFWELF